MQLPQFSVHAELQETHWWFLARRAILCELIRRVVPPSKQTVIFDIGCGTGGNLRALVPEYTCIGMDPSSDAVRLARERCPQAQFFCGTDLQDVGQVTPWATKLYLLLDVLEHVADDVSLFSQLMTVMRSGDHVLLTVPADMRLWSPHDVSLGHYRRYDQRRLMRVWEGLPVTPRLVSCYNTYLYPLVRAMRSMTRISGRTWGRAGMDFRVSTRLVNTVLTRIFSSERRVLVDCLEGRRSHGFSYGVSLLALLRREEGMMPPRMKPAAATHHRETAG